METRMAGASVEGGRRRRGTKIYTGKKDIALSRKGRKRLMKGDDYTNSRRA